MAERQWALVTDSADGSGRECEAEKGGESPAQGLVWNTLKTQARRISSTPPFLFYLHFSSALDPLCFTDRHLQTSIFRDPLSTRD